MAAAAAGYRRHCLWRSVVRLAGPHVDDADVTVGCLRSYRRGHRHRGGFNAAGGDAGPRWWLGLSGIAGILAGSVAFYCTGTTTLALLMVLAVWAIVIGVLQIWGAITPRKVVEGEWLLILNGLLSIAFGVIAMAQPATGALAFVWMIGWFAVVFGCLYIALAFRLKHLRA